MNTASKCFCLAVCSLLLVGCASTGTAQSPASKLDPAFQYDSDYIAAVEKASRSAGVEVVWVNPPRNRDREKR